MFPYNPFDDHHHMIKRSSSSTTSSSDHQNPNNNPDPPFLLPFPSSSSSPTFFDVDQQISPLNQILLHNQITSPKKSEEDKHQPTMTTNRRLARNLGAIPRRRAGKKDRHSKICTAQGIRDRRMRLSLQVARKFFDLQDALGYDKASKTIEWLFTKSKKAIHQLAKDHPQYDDDDVVVSESESLVVVSDCEVVSGILNIDNNNNNNNPSEERDERAKRPNNSRLEMREKARARARFRTREKMMARLGFFSGSTMFEGVHQGSNLNLNNSNNNNDNQEMVSLCGNVYDSLEQQYGDVGTIEKFLGNSSIVSCPSSDYYQRFVSGYVDPNNSFMGFFGNWDVLNGGTERSTSSPYDGGDANQGSLGENPSSIYSATP